MASHPFTTCGRCGARIGRGLTTCPLCGAGAREAPQDHPVTDVEDYQASVRALRQRLRELRREAKGA